jgi:hypothetical protein
MSDAFCHAIDLLLGHLFQQVFMHCISMYHYVLFYIVDSITRFNLVTIGSQILAFKLQPRFIPGYIAVIADLLSILNLSHDRYFITRQYYSYLSQLSS